MYNYIMKVKKFMDFFVGVEKTRGTLCIIILTETHVKTTVADLGTSIDLKSADKELKAVTPEKSKTCVTAFTKKLVTNFQLSRTRLGHFFLK